jgi:hypothetical protein
MTDAASQTQPRPAIRFIFEYDGDNLRLVAQQAVEMVVSETNPADVHPPGVYLDARDAGNRTLARVAARGAFTGSREVFPERHDEPISRIDVPQQRGAFTVTLPAVEAADHVTVVRVAPPAPGAGVERAAPRVVDLASFPLERR